MNRIGSAVFVLAGLVLAISPSALASVVASQTDASHDYLYFSNGAYTGTAQFPAPGICPTDQPCLMELGVLNTTGTDIPLWYPDPVYLHLKLRAPHNGFGSDGAGLFDAYLYDDADASRLCQLTAAYQDVLGTRPTSGAYFDSWTDVDEYVQCSNDPYYQGTHILRAGHSYSLMVYPHSAALVPELDLATNAANVPYFELSTDSFFSPPPAFPPAPVLFSDTFDAYATGTSLIGQGGWLGQGTSDAFHIVASPCLTGRCLAIAAGDSGAYRSAPATLDGTISVRFLAHNPGTWPSDYNGSPYRSDEAPYVGVRTSALSGVPTQYSSYLALDADKATLDIRTSSGDGTTLFSHVSFDTWHTLSYTWHIDPQGTYCYVALSLDGATPVLYDTSCHLSREAWGPDNPLLQGLGTFYLFTGQASPENLSIDDIGPATASSQSAPVIANLAQYQEDGTTPIAPGAGFVGNSVVLKADVADQASNAAALQVEIKPSDQPFDGTNLYTSATTTASGTSLATTTLSVVINNLITPTSTVPVNGIQQSFHWRSRVIDGQGATSAWTLYGTSPNATDFTATYTLGQAAADTAIQMIHQNYLWGGKGWDVYDKQFVDRDKVITNYNYWNSSGKVAQGNGVDCSGLVAWSYDYSHDPGAFFNHNFIGEPNANLQYYYNMQSTSTSDAGLQPGDVAFFGSGPSGTMSHVAMYVGNHGDYDVVEARNPQLKIATTTIEEIEDRSSFVSYGHPKNFAVSQVSANTASPVKLSVTDPSGITINTDMVTPSDEEYIREAGDMTYQTYGIDAAGYPEDIVYSPILKPGVYHIAVTPLPGTTPSQTYSLTFTTGGTTIPLAANAPLSSIPSTGFGIVVASNGTATLDTTPPEATIGFSTSTKRIVVTGTDDMSTTTIASTTSSIVISDAAGNTLTLKTAQNANQANYAALVIPSLAYSTGTTTNATTSIRVFWTTDKTDNYPLFIEAIKTPTQRIIAIYTSLLNKTYVVTSTASDDTADLSLQSALLLLRQKLKTYSGLVIPTVTTNKGNVLILY